VTFNGSVYRQAAEQFGRTATPAELAEAEAEYRSLAVE